MAFLIKEGLIKGEELPAGELPRKIVEASNRRVFVHLRAGGIEIFHVAGFARIRGVFMACLRILTNPATLNSRRGNHGFVPYSHLLTAQPETPAFSMAGASGWAANDDINNLGTTLVINMAAVVSVVRYSAEPQFSFDAF